MFWEASEEGCWGWEELGACPGAGVALGRSWQCWGERLGVLWQAKKGLSPAVGRGEQGVAFRGS